MTWFPAGQPLRERASRMPDAIICVERDSLNRDKHVEGSGGPRKRLDGAGRVDPAVPELGSECAPP